MDMIVYSLEHAPVHSPHLGPDPSDVEAICDEQLKLDISLLQALTNGTA